MDPVTAVVTDPDQAMVAATMTPAAPVLAWAIAVIGDRALDRATGAGLPRTAVPAGVAATAVVLAPDTGPVAMTPAVPALAWATAATGVAATAEVLAPDTGPVAMTPAAPALAWATAVTAGRVTAVVMGLAQAMGPVPVIPAATAWAGGVMVRVQGMVPVLGMVPVMDLLVPVVPTSVTTPVTSAPLLLQQACCPDPPRQHAFLTARASTTTR
jgi:hypothetical protein